MAILASVWGTPVCVCVSLLNTDIGLLCVPSVAANREIAMEWSHSHACVCVCVCVSMASWV